MLDRVRTKLGSLASLVFLCTSLVLTTQSCVFAPFSSPKTARSLAPGKSRVDFGLAPTLYFQFEHGLSENFDYGFLAEVQLGYLVGVFGKYTFTAPGKDTAFALVGGASLGSSIVDSKSVFVGPLFSTKFGSFEFFVSPRYNQVYFDSFEFEDASSDDSNDDSAFELEKIDASTFSYIQTNFGFNIWASEESAFTVSGVHIYASGAVSNDVAPALGFLIEF